MYKKTNPSQLPGGPLSPPLSPRPGPAFLQLPASPTGSPLRAASAPGPDPAPAGIPASASPQAQAGGVQASSSSASMRHVTLRVASKDLKRGGTATRTVTADDIIGSTQATASQPPIVYFGSWNAGQPEPNGRATQSHPHADNVGVHPPKLTRFFGNIPESILEWFPKKENEGSELPCLIRAVESFEAGGRTETGQSCLVELHKEGEKISGSHRSRSSFLPATTSEQRETLFKSLRTGQLNVSNAPSDED